MIDERAFLAQLESANADQLSQILRRPSADEERVLEIYFGAERLQHLRSLALSTERRALRRGNVVVLHGIMGGEMTVYPANQRSQFIWLNVPRLAVGAAGWLRMTPDLRPHFDVRSTGIIKKYYSEQILGLGAAGWNVQAFCYDWRQDLAIIADALRARIEGWFGSDAPVNLVAHSMGGLVSRTYILRHSDRWEKGGRLVMLGTPNHGSFAIPQVITGAYDTVRKLALLDLSHSLRDLCTIMNTFPGSMQMLPSHLEMPAMERLFRQEQWAPWGVPQRILDVARASHERLRKVVDGERMFYVAGFNQATKVGVKDWNRLDTSKGYADSLEGDGTVPHSLSFLRDGSSRIPTYFVECSHGALPKRSEVIAATDQILSTGKCGLPTSFTRMRAPAATAAATAAKEAREQAEEEMLRELVRRVRARSRAVGTVRETPVSGDEMAANAILVRSFLNDESVPLAAEPVPPAGPAVVALPSQPTPRIQARPVSISIRLVRGRIENADAQAIAVGHYIGVAPQFAERAIDEAISAPQNRKKRAVASNEGLIITDLCQRGVIVGELAQNFILPDPRKKGRIVVIAGMGRPGTFREAELTVLVRELIWTLGRSGHKSLATVLIGGGAGNLGTQDAVNAWLRGVRRALHDTRQISKRLQSITFVELDPGNFVRMHTALAKAVADFMVDPEAPLRISYSGPDKKVVRAAKRVATRAAATRGAEAERKSFSTPAVQKAEAEPTRLTVQLQAEVFQFAALTKEASIPQRDTRIDPTLVNEANDQLPGAGSFAQQRDHGHVLASVLLPQDMREMIERQQVPIVLALDATTARIHWEMLANEPAETSEVFDPKHFLGTANGLTRQLRTTFAQLPEPPIVTDRPLRVLVVADPAEDAPLPGAQEEGAAVADIFEHFRSRTGRKVDVGRLFGPEQATRIAVLDRLINQRFDMMHYAGHAWFNKENPSLSGWRFSGGKDLSANELNRIDRIPRFIFSNACESGITPDRASERTALLAPSFAEAFFARGVANFICTAWPIDDDAARQFAERFYRGILGFLSADGSGESLHEAMRAARCAIAKIVPGGMQTWGAYQHYGDPNLRLISDASRTIAPGSPKMPNRNKPARTPSGRGKRRN